MRFSEFHDNWQKLSLKKCSTNLNYGLSAPAIEYDNVHKYIRITDIDENTNQFNQSNLTSPQFYDDEHIVKENDILFARTGASVGKTYHYNKGDGLLYYAGFLIAAHIKENYNSSFIFYYTQTPKYKKWVKIMSTRSGQPGINAEEYGSFPIWIPSKFEQDKIVCLLEKIDKEIQTQIKIIDNYISLLNSLRDHLIYTHNSKKAPLSGYIDIYNGYTFKSKNYIKDGKYKVITISNVTGQRFVNLASINTINKIPFDIQNYQILAKDSILVSLTGNVGRTSICNVDNCLLNQRVALVKCKNIDSKYIYHILSSTRFLRKMCLSSQGAAQKNISTKDILDYMIPLHSNQEIKNITLLLEVVENKLDIEKNILNFLYRQKTYLLKNMFI